jgi:hypothetical protein
MGEVTEMGKVVALKGAHLQFKKAAKESGHL